MAILSHRFILVRVQAHYEQVTRLQRQVLVSKKFVSGQTYFGRSDLGLQLLVL